MDFIAIKYIGKRPEYVDGTYGTRISFVQGETKLVPADKAELMLRHADVYERGEETKDMPKPAKNKKGQKKQTDEEVQLQEMRDAISIMEKDALREFAKTRYSIELKGNKKVETFRQEVLGLVDQYGIQ